MKKLFLILIATCTAIIMSCEIEESIVPINTNELPDSLMVISINNADTVIQDTVLKEPIVIEIQSLTKTRITNPDASYKYSDIENDKSLVLYSTKLDVSEYPDLLNDNIINELLSMDKQTLREYEFPLVDLGYQITFIQSRNGSVRNCFGMLDYGIIDNTIYKVEFYFDDTDKTILEVNKNSEDLFLRMNSNLIFSFFPGGYDNETSYLLMAHSLDYISFKGQYVTYNLYLNSNDVINYLNIFTVFSKL